MDRDLIAFWIEAQRTATYYADQLLKRKLNNFEYAFYSQLCNTLESFFRATNLKMNPEELDDPEPDPGGLSSEAT